MSGAKTVIAKIPAREWRGLVPSWAGGRLQIAMTCHLCGENDHWSAAQMISPQSVIPKIVQLGWDVNGNITCPKCVKLRRRNRQEKVMATNVTKLPITEDTGSLLSDQKRHKRLVILQLEDDFDEGAKRYRSGKSDDTVARDLNLSVGFIRTVREEFYGVLAEPSEIAEFRSEIIAIRRLADDLEVRLNGLCNRNGWKA